MNFLLWLLPDAFVELIVHAIVIIGILGYLFSDTLGRFVPQIKGSYLKIIFAIVFVVGIFLEGSLAATKEWRQKIELLEQKAKLAEEKSAQENVRIVTEYVTKTQVVEKRGKDIIHYIDREIVKFDESCEIPKEFIDIHNQAAEEVQ